MKGNGMELGEGREEGEGAGGGAPPPEQFNGALI